MYHKQRQRLVRPDDWTANELAQELFAMFGPNVPLDHQGPITVYAQTGAPLVVEGAEEDDPIIRVVNRDTNLDTDFSLYAEDPAVNPNGPYVGVVILLQSTGIYTVTIFPVSLSDPSEDVTVTLISGSVEINQIVTVFKDADGNHFMAGTPAQMLYVPISTGLTDQWTLSSSADEFLGVAHYRTKVNLTQFTEGRVVARVQNDGIAGSLLRLQYSTDSEVSWDQTNVTVNIANTGTREGSWSTLPNQLRADVSIRLVGSGGNGVDTVRFGTVSVQFR